MMQNNMESIWADGVIPDFNNEDLLTAENVLSMCVRFTVEKVIENKGYEVVSVNVDLKSYPNVVLKKEDKLYAVAVVPCIYPSFSGIRDELRIRFVKDSKMQNGIPVFCPIVIASNDKTRASKGLLLKGDLFRLLAVGQKILTEEEKQDLSPNGLDFKL